MSNEFNESFQYDSCVSRGICSISPRNSALQTVIVLYLRLFAKYLIKLKKEELNDDLMTFITEVISSAIFNYEFNDNTFLSIVQKMRIELPKIIDEFYLKFPDDNMEKEKKKVIEIFQETLNINSSIKYGERIFNDAQQNIKIDIRNLYSILLLIAKTISINLLELKSFDKNFVDAYIAIIEILDKINIDTNDIDNLKKQVIKVSKINTCLLRKIHQAQEERYGEFQEIELSFSTEPGKAVLVVGSNIRELEDILENLKTHNIDIYTHDEMIYAHFFPFFKKYEHLKGQFGLGLENCLLDFATFPGPIVLTKNSLHNVENFYRGRLFTTDEIYIKGVIKILENDYSKLIEVAENSKGFKTGKICEKVNLGFSYKKVLEQIFDKMENKNFKKIFIIGLDGYSTEHNVYFEKLIKLIPKDMLIISFFYNFEQENLIYVNTCFESYSIIKFYDCIKEFQIPIIFFIPRCDKNSVPQMIDFSCGKNVKIFVGKCIPIILNPSLMNTMKEKFDINLISSVKKDLEKIL